MAWLLHASLMLSAGALLSGCGSSNSSAPSSADLQKNIAAATATANDASANAPCAGVIGDNASSGSLPGFYWEIGDKNGPIASGTVGGNVARDTQMDVASSSKLLYGSYVAEKFATVSNGVGQMPANLVPYLNFTSGYDEMNDYLCMPPPPGLNSFTVGDCLAQAFNRWQTPSSVGKFSYSSGHLEMLQGAAASDIAGIWANTDNPGAAATDEDLAKLLISAYPNVQIDAADLSFSYPAPAGGGHLSAATYALFLQAVLRGDLKISSFFQPTASDSYAVCADTSGSSGCNAVVSPLPEGLAWHYSITHWIEDNPPVSIALSSGGALSLPQGDGAYSSPGRNGFYPWIDSSKTYYGIVARYDTNPTVVATDTPYFKSAVCGASIRMAFMNGVQSQVP